MADIIDFRATTKPYSKKKIANNSNNTYGEIILFSGVRIQHDDVQDSNFSSSDNQSQQTGHFLETKSR